MAKLRLVRDINQVAVLTMLRQGSYSRAQLARELGLTPSTISAIAADLLELGLVREFGTTEVGGKGGRPGSRLSLDPTGASFLGADFDMSHVTVVALGLDGTELGRVRRAVPGDADLDEVILRICRLVDRLRGELGDRLDGLQGLGVSGPGMLSGEGRLSWMPGIHWPELDLAGRLSDDLEMPVVVDNDANASAMAELLLGGGTGSDFLYLLLDRGVGGGLVLGGSLYRGARGNSGEVGHIRLDPAGPICPHCGGAGCFENLVNRDALSRYFREAGGEHAPAEEVAERAARGEPPAVAAVATWVEWLGRGLASLVFVLNPAEVVLGGSLAHLVPDLCAMLGRRLVEARVPGAEDVVVRTSTLGDAGGAIGAAALVYRRMFEISGRRAEGSPAWLRSQPAG